jgi:type I restriction enzyme S subunit
MTDEWRDVTWGDLATLEYGKSLRGYRKASGKYRVYGTNGPIGWHDESLCGAASVIIGRKGAYRGVHYSPDPFFVIDTAFYLKPKGKFDILWAYYELLTHDINSMDSGSAIPSTSRDEFYALPVRLPLPSEQKAIAHILGVLDDKIALNRRMNETLEAMAGAIFKSWFVDFDPVRAKMDGRKPAGMDDATAALFPGSFEDSELGTIPTGWQVQTLSELTSEIGSGATPRGGSKVYISEGVALVRSQNVYDYEFRWDGLARITREAAEALKGVTLKPNDILFNITGASILRTCVVDLAVLPARVNQHVARIRAKEGIPARFLHLHLVRQEMKDHLIGFNAGATREAVTKGHLEGIQLVVPPPVILKVFDKNIAPIYARKESNLRQISTLTVLRNILLPKLLSGEIRVTEAEQAVAKVA